MRIDKFGRCESKTIIPAKWMALVRVLPAKTLTPAIRTPAKLDGRYPRYHCMKKCYLPCSVVRPEEADVHVVLRVDPHGLAGPEGKPLQFGPNQKMGNPLKQKQQKTCVSLNSAKNMKLRGKLVQRDMYSDSKCIRVCLGTIFNFIRCEFVRVSELGKLDGSNFAVHVMRVFAISNSHNLHLFS